MSFYQPTSPPVDETAWYYLPSRPRRAHRAPHSSIKQRDNPALVTAQAVAVAAAARAARVLLGLLGPAQVFAAPRCCRAPPVPALRHLSCRPNPQHQAAVAVAVAVAAGEEVACSLVGQLADLAPWSPAIKLDLARAPTLQQWTRMPQLRFHQTSTAPRAVCFQTPGFKRPARRTCPRHHLLWHGD